MMDEPIDEPIGGAQAYLAAVIEIWDRTWVPFDKAVAELEALVEEAREYMIQASTSSEKEQAPIGEEELRRRGVNMDQPGVRLFISARDQASAHSEEQPPPISIDAPHEHEWMPVGVMSGDVFFACRCTATLRKVAHYEA